MKVRSLGDDLDILVYPFSVEKPDQQSFLSDGMRLARLRNDIALITVNDFIGDFTPLTAGRQCRTRACSGASAINSELT